MQNLANHLTQQQIDDIMAGHLAQRQINDILDQLRDNEPGLSESDLSAIAEELTDKYNRRKITKTPILDGFIKKGIIKVNPNEYHGLAEDGTEVSFGSDPEGVERYLQNRPNPKDW